MPGESAENKGLTAQQKMNEVMKEIVNWLKTETERLSFLSLHFQSQIVRSYFQNYN